MMRESLTYRAGEPRPRPPICVFRKLWIDCRRLLRRLLAGRTEGDYHNGECASSRSLFSRKR